MRIGQRIDVVGTLAAQAASKIPLSDAGSLDKRGKATSPSDGGGIVGGISAQPAENDRPTNPDPGVRAVVRAPELLQWLVLTNG